MSNAPIRPDRVRSYFKFIFIVVTGITLLCLGIIVLLSFISPEAKEMAEVPILQKKLLEICTVGVHSGFGAIFGLVGGKVT